MASSLPLSEANTRFSLALFKKLSAEDKIDNVFYSPLSISSALAMLLLGARGNTATQMSEVLCFTKAEEPMEGGGGGQMQMQMQMQNQVQQEVSKILPPHLLESNEDIHVSFSQLMSDLNKPDAPYSLSLANRLYGQQSFEFIQAFLDKTRKHYDAELESVDFGANPNAARLNINSWVEKQTQEKIKDLLAEDAVNSSTILVLVNAIYFKGNWGEKFDEKNTRDAQFRVNKIESKPVKMMNQGAKFPLSFIPELNCQVLEMSYVGKDLSMLIFLPNEIEDNTTGLEKIERELTYENFMEWTSRDMENVEVQVGLPRFKMEKMCDLKDVLTSMGMVDAFRQELCNLAGMSPANNLVLSKVVHKAFVEVNEEGTEAAAATAVVVVERSVMYPEVFYADHPFLFFIRHNPSKSILFAGRYSSPA